MLSTDSRERLTNIRACDETFKAANGKKSKCDSIGDMPVLAKDTTGRIFRFVLKNVRYVPEFKYTLLSVNQLWNEQGINATFADAKHLVFPDGAVVPFDPRFALCAVTMVSEPGLLKVLKQSTDNRAATKRDSEFGGSAEHKCLLGFHNIKSTAHVARLPAAQAGELLHRRSHMGVNKIRSLPHVSGDAPKILASAP